MSRNQLPLTLLPAGLPPADSGGAPGHAGALDLAGVFLLLSVGDLWAAGFFPVSSAYLGFAHGPAVGVQGLVGTAASFL